MLIPHSDDWNYLEFHPDFGVTMEPAADGAYELVFENEDPQAANRGAYWTFPHQKEFRTRDMFLVCLQCRFGSVANTPADDKLTAASLKAKSFDFL